MKNIKKVVSILLCLILCAFMCTTAFAAVNPSIKISDKAALAGQEVILDVTLNGNPGIMAMAFSITYDNTQFEFVDVTNGFISTPTYKDHSDKGYVAFSVSESSDKTDNGTILSLKFRIKDGAKPGKYTINLGNPNYKKYGNKIDNCFSNSKEKLIVPKINAGSITVQTECDYVGHNYNDWSVTEKSSCTKTGIQSRTCSRCGNVEEKILPFNHDLEDDWTVDKVATPEESGIMSRHCKICDARFEEIFFTYEEVGDGDGDGNDNSSAETDSSNTDNSQGNQSSTSSGNTSTDNTSSDNTSSNNTGSGNTSTGNTSSGNNTSTGNTSSGNNTSSGSTSSNNTSSAPTKKPGINNTLGAKNPLSAVEGTKDYQDKYVEHEAEFENSSDSGEIKDETSSSFFATATGIILIIIGILLSISILAFGIILIIINIKKSQ